MASDTPVSKPRPLVAVCIQCVTARALSRHLEWRYHGNQWPHRTIAATELVYHMTRRINEASVCTGYHGNILILHYSQGLYQMFGVLGDVMVISESHTLTLSHTL